jgi:hypothetical protein
MANTTFSGPVRSEAGFQVATKNNVTGVFTTRYSSALPDYTGLTAAALATGGAITLINNQINTVNYTGNAAAGVTLPAATAGDVCVYVQSIDTTGGVAALTFNAAGTDSWATGSVIESRAGNAVTHDISTVGETTLVFTPAAVTTNLLTTGGTIAFICYTTGTWNIAYRLGGAGTAVTGVFAFAA